MERSKVLSFRLKDRFAKCRGSSIREREKDKERERERKRKKETERERQTETNRQTH
jgi:hypothetical protein